MTIAGATFSNDVALRELQAVGEIAHAFLVADHPEEVHQFALDRVTPILGASFALVLLLDTSGEFMYPVAQREWPDRYREWIGALRVRVGQGPSGVAVAEQRVVEVADLHSDPLLSDWYEVATELAFRSIIAAPLLGSRGPLGAVAFYFADERHVTKEQRDLVRVIADQLAAVSDKAQRNAELRRANAALEDANATLESQSREQGETQQRQLKFFLHFATAVVQLASAPGTDEHRLQRLYALANSAQGAVSLENRTLNAVSDDVDPREPLLRAVAEWRTRARPLPILMGEPTVLLPTMRSDIVLLSRAVSLALGIAVQEAQRDESREGVRADVELGRGFVAYRLQWTSTADEGLSGGRVEPTSRRSGTDGVLFDPFEALARAVEDESMQKDSNISGNTTTSPLDLPLARSIARLLGGDIHRICESAGELAIESLSLIFPLDAAPDTGAAVARLNSALTR